MRRPHWKKLRRSDEPYEADLVDVPTADMHNLYWHPQSGMVYRHMLHGGWEILEATESTTTGDEHDE